MTRTLLFILALNSICLVGSVLKLLPDQRFITSGSVVEFRSIKIKKDIFWLNKCGLGGQCDDDQNTSNVLAVKDKTTRTRGVTKWRIFNRNSSHVIRSGDIVILENMFVRVFNSKPAYLGKCSDEPLILIECDNDSDFIKWRLVSVSHRQGMGIYESTMLRMVHVKTNSTIAINLKKNVQCGNMKQKGVIVTSDKDPENYMETWGVHLTTDSKFEYRVHSGYCEGGDLKTVDLGVEECQLLCDEVESCVGFMYTRYERIINGVMTATRCWLKNASCQSVVAREYTHMYYKTQKEVTTEQQYTTETTTYIADTTIVTSQSTPTTDMETQATSSVTSQRAQPTTIMTSPVVQSTEQSTQQITEQSTKEPIEQSTVKQSTEVSTKEPIEQSTTELPIKHSTEVSTEESIKQSIEQTSVSYISTDATLNSTEFRIQSQISVNTVNKSDISTTSEISYNITQVSLNTTANATELSSSHTEATPWIIFLKTHTTTLPWLGTADKLKSEPETSWSESDKRISAVAVGMTAMLIIVIFLGFVFLLDIPTYVKHFKMMRRNMKSLYQSMNAVDNKDEPTLNT